MNWMSIFYEQQMMSVIVAGAALWIIVVILEKVSEYHKRKIDRLQGDSGTDSKNPK